MPVPNELPPEEAAYQLIVPADAVAYNVSILGPHIAAGVVLVIVGNGVTVAITEVNAADEHAPFVT